MLGPFRLSSEPGWQAFTNDGQDSGGATPTVLKDDVKYRHIAWSPTDEWIVYADESVGIWFRPMTKPQKFLAKYIPLLSFSLKTASS
jgi:hypothetical protein